MGMGNKKYPKVLIVGQIFSHRSGGGITMSNLFKGWPKDSLAVASGSYLSYGLDVSVCERYYQLGYNGKLHPFPLNLVLPRIKCGEVDIRQITAAANQKLPNKPGKFKTIYRLMKGLLVFLGLYNFLYRMKVTPEFKEWLVNYNPDIIYSQLESLELMSLVEEIHILTHKPIAIHIMDDWPATINKPNLLYSYWQKVLDNEFKKILNQASVFMSICDTMSEEYKRRYNKDFTPFHNPIELGKWLPYSRTNWEFTGNFTILYAGRLGYGVNDSIVDIANAVNDLCSAYPNIVFELQTPDISLLKKIVKLNENIKWMPPIAYSALASKFASVDMLVIPFDFDDDSLAFLRYSFSTKVPEYMISGTPVLVYAHQQTALVKYALKEEWAYVVTENKSEALKNSIKEMFLNISLRKQLAEKAMKVVVQNDNADIVRENFRKSLIID
jgi:glycosyltransferase involved in cell wall biosynthesis